MARTAGCFLALGFLVTLAAACGDDDVVTPGIGGSAGAGGRGTAGAAGAAGRGGRGGAAGTAGTAGRGGSAAGTGGSAAGTGGSAAGTGGVGGTDVDPEPDAGADAAPDSGDVVVGETCPNFTAATALIQAGPNDQQVVFARVFFDGLGGAEVVLRNVAEPDAGETDFAMFENVQFCTGPGTSLANCQEAFDLCDVDEESLAAGAETTCTLTLPDAEGELALANINVDAVPPTFGFVFTYMKYAIDGAFTSPGTPSLQTEAGPLWNGETIDMDLADNAIVLEGEAVVASDFTTCTAVLP